MAHRKLQQEIDRVFKKITEGLEIFNTYYERHESCTNNPSQKDKLEGDLKREVKKLQRLREQIKSWQSSPDVKDKDSLLEYRRSVEIAMEKYKAVEKASKEKAYSNICLKRSEVLDPQERERRDVENYLSQAIDELERQYDQAQAEIDRLIVLGKKKKSTSAINEEKRNHLKNSQTRYRWHQQQMELALRLLANEELDPQSVRDIEDDINYFIDSNQDEGFIEDETIYSPLDLDLNEAIAHEVAVSFATQTNDDKDDSDFKDDSKLSKKEQRKLERETRKAAKAAGKGGPIPSTSDFVIENSSELNVTTKDKNESEPKVSESNDARVISGSISPSITPTSIPSSANTTAHSSSSKTDVSIPVKQQLLSQLSVETLDFQNNTYSSHKITGPVTPNTLKDIGVDIRPPKEPKWTNSLNLISKNGTEQNSYLLNTIQTTSNLSDKNCDVMKQEFDDSLITQPPPLRAENKTNFQIVSDSETIADDYETDITDDELDNEPKPIELTQSELERREQTKAQLTETLCHDFQLLQMPVGIQNIIMGSLINANNLHPPDGKLGGFRRFADICKAYRLEEIPPTVNPPPPLDALRSMSQWDMVRASLAGCTDELLILEKFGNLEIFTLFYNYYYSITPLEHSIAYNFLNERNWKISKTRDTWFLRQSQPKFSNELCEVADYKIFKLDDWTVIDKVNFKLEYSILKDPLLPPHDLSSHSQQLLLQLNQGNLTKKE